MVKTRKHILFIIPYFGEAFPKYFDLFLHSVSYNEDYNFIIFSDIQVDRELPRNLELVQMTKEELSKNISTKCKVPFHLLNPYKLCDLKPAYGHIFEDYLNDYDFWGHVDIDLVLGNLNNFLINDDKLDVYDLISFRKEWISGSFCLYKNKDEVNKLYQNSTDWVAVLSTPNYLGFDEISRAKEPEISVFRSILNGDNLIDIETEIESFTEVVLKSKIKYKFQTLIKESLAKHMLINFDKGKISIGYKGTSKNLKNKEFLLYHYITEKRNGIFKYPNWNSIPEKFYISRLGFHKHKFSYWIAYYLMRFDNLLTKTFRSIQ